MPATERRRIQVSFQLAGIALAAAIILGACGSHDLLDQSTIRTNPQDATTSCSPGREGCPCSTAGASTDCGQLVQNYGSYVSCSEGTSTCQQGSWGPCLGDTVVNKSLQGSTLGKNQGIRVLSVTRTCDPCDPNDCTETSEDGGDVPDGAPVLVTQGGVTIPPNGCVGLQCQVQPGCAAPTTLTGRVYDPAGNNPLFGAYVFIPVDPNPANLPAFSAGATCDACSGAGTLGAVALTQTDAGGNFTLTNVPTTSIAPGAPIPLVVQLGKWRRVELLTAVPACQTTQVPAASSRLPRSQTDGYGNHADMPQVAFVSGSQDPFECMLLKAGVDPGEFGSSTLNSTRRFHYYNSPDSAGKSIDPAFGSVVTGEKLWNNINPAWPLSAYDVVILACEGGEHNVSDRSTTGYTNLVSYAGIGGRVFMTHFSYVWMKYSTSALWKGIPATWGASTSSIDTQDPLDSTIVTTGFPKGQSFLSWLGNVNALDSNHQLEIHSGRQDTTLPLAAGVQPWLNATDTVKGGSNFDPAFTFETPLGASAANQCGRAVFTDFHVATSAQVSGNRCQQNSDCGFGATCTPGAATGTCQDPPCTSPTDCGDPAWACSGATAGTCQRAPCTTGSTCASGQCVTVGASSVCGCTANADCGTNGTCDTGTHICTVGSCASNADCFASEQNNDATCQGATAGTCAPNACTTNAQCAALSSGGQEQCNGTNCGGCRSSQDCPGGTVCTGGGTGTCTGTSTNFPYECSQGPLDPQEAALEFLFFDLSSCVGPAPPPQQITYKPVSFSVDFQSAMRQPDGGAPCPLGASVRWLKLQWKATIPDTASIVFSAQTAAATADGGIPDYTGVQSVELATATATTPNLPTGQDDALIDVASIDGGGEGAFNTAAPPVTSAQDLRLTITLNPTTDQSQAPTLIEWDVQSDCLPTE
jgi:hypothetical protein